MSSRASQRRLLASMSHAARSALTLSGLLLLGAVGAGSLSGCSRASSRPASQTPTSASASTDANQDESKAAGSAQTAGTSGLPANNDSASDSPAATIPLLHAPANFPWLGIELRATDAGSLGVMVQRVLPGSPAERASLQEGDIIVSISDTPMQSPAELSSFVRQQSTQANLAMDVRRSGQTHLLRVQLEAMPSFEDRLRLAFIGRKAPEIDGVVTFQGEAASLAELQGKVVVLEFWASFCGVCRVMGPILDDWQRKYGVLGAHVFGITPDPPSLGQEVARRSNMHYTLASDPESEISREYLASQIPTLFVIDKQGVIRDAIVGYDALRLQQAEALIERLLQDPT